MRFHTSCQTLPTRACRELPAAAVRRAERLCQRSARAGLMEGRKSVMLRGMIAASWLGSSARLALICIRLLCWFTVLAESLSRSTSGHWGSWWEGTSHTDSLDKRLYKNCCANDRTHAQTSVIVHKCDASGNYRSTSEAPAAGNCH